ncbi:MAG: VWA domain-containing protein, partial [Verrucomicrobia bacterium]|nr:VWA domain-containing protein [Verrucomicrobiota bacterium]
VAAVLALSAVRNNDKVGLLLFTDHTERYLPPAKGRSHVLAIISQILFHQPSSRGTDIAAALNHISQAMPRRSTIFVISDFMDENWQRALKVTGRKHDVVAIPVTDASERELADVGWIVFEDAETGEILEMNTSDARMRKIFTEGADQRTAALRQLLRRSAVDAIEVQTDRPYLRSLIKFFETRYHRLHP